MSKKENKNTSNEETEYPSWYEFSRNGGTFADHLNGKLERLGLPTFSSAEGSGEENSAPTERATLRFVPFREIPANLDHTVKEGDIIKINVDEGEWLCS
jgi:hypothetical protein|tara:strand:+ start:169 stop:465 length:297 start_codon:yes stop_codon:yes gene_type:complete